METPDFRSRLRRLRRDEQQPPEPRAPSAGLPESLRRRLARSDATSAAAAPVPALALGATSCAPPADLVAHATEHGRVLARSRCFDAGHRHGAWSLDEAPASACADYALLTGDASLGALDLRNALFLDTETTGLHGGAGTYVFLVGLGRFTERGFELWQGFLREPADERALLAACAERIAASAGVVSFFGKAFDRHRLEDKMRLFGIAPPFARVPHLDLYHPLRRLYRSCYGDSRLRTFERELCSVEREDDLPGSFAPAAWFDFLAGRPHLLEGVFRHNADDVLSLVTLAAHLGRTSAERRASGEALAGDGAARTEGLVRSLVLARRREEALELVERFLASAGGSRPPLAMRALRLQHAELVERVRGANEALESWRSLAAEPEDAHTPECFAHMARLLAKARRTDEALECCRVARALFERYAMDSRLRRLQREIARVESNCGR